MVSLNLFIQRCVSGILWYLMVKERGKKGKENRKTTNMAPDTASYFMSRPLSLTQSNALP